MVNILKIFNNLKKYYQDYFFKKTNKIGQSFFNLGTFFLATALPISGLFFLISIYISFVETKFTLFKDKWNISILFIGGLLLVNSIRFSFINLDDNLSSFDRSISFYSLFNWIPLFLLFIGFQYYLKNQFQRELFSKYFISGTIPVLLSCILQYWFKVYGPFRGLGGLIVIFNKQLGGNDGVSGLFSNQNYTGVWLSVSLPILYFLISKYKFFDAKKLFLISLLLITIILIFTTLSRNAFIGSIIPLILIFGLKSIFIFLLLGLFIYLSFGVFETFIPISFKINLISKLSFDNIINFLHFTRIKIWSGTFRLILEKPIFGFGASTFSIIFYDLTNLKMQHSHNMPLQLAYEFGLPISLALTTFISLLFYKSWRNIFQHSKDTRSYFFNKCWLASCLVVILNHVNDITYYDGKISILIWILFAGLKCILDETNQTKFLSPIK